MTNEKRTRGWHPDAMPSSDIPEGLKVIHRAINARVADEMYRALCVITKDPQIKSYLQLRDPKALTQCRHALGRYEWSFHPKTEESEEIVKAMRIT